MSLHCVTRRSVHAAISSPAATGTCSGDDTRLRYQAKTEWVMRRICRFAVMSEVRHVRSVGRKVSAAWFYDNHS